MLKNYITLTLAFIFLLFTFGCGGIDQVMKKIDQASEPKVLVSDDGNCRITIPASWISDSLGADGAVLQASNRLSELYVVVIPDSKADFGKNAGIDYIKDLVQKGMSSKLSEASFSESIPTKVGEFEARQFEVTGQMEKIRVNYLISVIDTPQNYYQIITWTLPSRYDRNKDTMQDVINSFKLQENPEAPTPTTTPKIKKK